MNPIERGVKIIKKTTDNGGGRGRPKTTKTSVAPSLKLVVQQSCMGESPHSRQSSLEQPRDRKVAVKWWMKEIECFVSLHRHHQIQICKGEMTRVNERVECSFLFGIYFLPVGRCPPGRTGRTAGRLFRGQSCCCELCIEEEH